MAATLAFVFPGQGSQHVGMLDALPAMPATQGLLEQAESFTGVPLRALALDGPAAALAETRAAQPLLFITGLAWARALLRIGASPTLVAGHSLGELTALAFAGVIPVDACLELVCDRGRIMGEVAAEVPGTMSAVLGLERDAVAGLIQTIDGVWLANDNSATQAVISGTHEGIAAATEALTAAGARRVVALDVAGPFHSPLMAPAAERFAELVGRVAFEDARIPVIQNTDPTPTTDADTIRTRLLEQITAPVRWRETMTALVDGGVSVVVESGPGAVLAGLAKRVEGVSAIAVETDGIDRVVEVLA